MDRDDQSAAAPPRFGALLRLCTQHARGRVIDAIRAAGFTDLQDAHLVVFQYPIPDGVRPSDLARRIRMSRQATNYLISQLEHLGYLERRQPPDNERRLVHLTLRGRQVFETIFAALRDLQREWEDRVGQKRFADFLEVLTTLADDERRTLFDPQPVPAVHAPRLRKAHGSKS
jgi:DNA-binding MarR family transcriptional regulator